MTFRVILFFGCLQVKLTHRYVGFILLDGVELSQAVKQYRDWLLSLGFAD